MDPATALQRSTRPQHSGYRDAGQLTNGFISNGDELVFGGVAMPHAIADLECARVDACIGHEVIKPFDLPVLPFCNCHELVALFGGLRFLRGQDDLPAG